MPTRSVPGGLSLHTVRITLLMRGKPKEVAGELSRLSFNVSIGRSARLFCSAAAGPQV